MKRIIVKIEGDDETQRVVDRVLEKAGFEATVEVEDVTFYVHKMYQSREYGGPEEDHGAHGPIVPTASRTP